MEDGDPLAARGRELSATPPLLVFVYGTLKRGLRNCALAASASRVLPARVCGHLYEPAHRRYPMLAVPPATVLAMGTTRADVDVAECDRLAMRAPAVSPAEGYVLVKGELLVFDEPATALPPLDRLESFHPGHPSNYHRVLVPIEAEGFRAAWVYVVPHGQLRGLIDLGACDEWFPHGVA